MLEAYLDEGRRLLDIGAGHRCPFPNPDIHHGLGLEEHVPSDLIVHQDYWPLSRLIVIVGTSVLRYFDPSASNLDILDVPRFSLQMYTKSVLPFHGPQFDSEDATRQNALHWYRPVELSISPVVLSSMKSRASHKRRPSPPTNWLVSPAAA